MWPVMGVIGGTTAGGSMEPLSRLVPGDPQQIGQYRIVARLGAGGMGRVYLGRTRGGRAVAVKVVRPELAEDREFRLRFAREVSAARLVNGVFTAGVVDADTEATLPWLATAFVPGVSLDTAVARHGGWPERPIMAMAAGLAEALEAIHAAGLIHRDLKPSNVLLATDGPRVIDFGISVAGEASALTRTGVVVGTPGFMSPEQLTGAAVGTASDVFSLGAVLAFTASGSGPFGTGSAQALMFRIVHEQPNLTVLPPRLRALVARCLDKEPGSRPGIGDLLAELAETVSAGQTTLPFTGAAWLPEPVARTVREHAQDSATLREGDTATLREAVTMTKPPSAPPPAPPFLAPTPPPPPTPSPGSWGSPETGSATGPPRPGSARGRTRWVLTAVAAILAVGLLAWQAGANFGTGTAGSDGTSSPTDIVKQSPGPSSDTAAASEEPATEDSEAPAQAPTSEETRAPAPDAEQGTLPVLGTWRGNYVCNQGITGLILTIEEASDGSMEAVFSFYPSPSNPTVPRGSFAMTGTYSEPGLTLRGDHWIEQPPGFLMVNLQASYDSNTPGHLDGTVDGAGCSSFSVDRTS